MAESSERVLEEMEGPAIDTHTVVHVVVDILKQSPLHLHTDRELVPVDT